MISYAIRIIAACQIIGGLWGITLMGYRMVSVLDNSTFTLYLTAYMLPFVISVIAGILLLKKQQTGIKLSLLVQLCQIPYFTISGLYYSFIAGPCIGIRGTVTEQATLGFNALFGGYCQIQTGLPDSLFAFGINLAALLFFITLIYIDRTKRLTFSSSVAAQKGNQVSMRGQTVVSPDV